MGNVLLGLLRFFYDIPCTAKFQFSGALFGENIISANGFASEEQARAIILRVVWEHHAVPEQLEALTSARGGTAATAAAARGRGCSRSLSSRGSGCSGRSAAATSGGRGRGRGGHGHAGHEARCCLRVVAQDSGRTDLGSAAVLGAAIPGSAARSGAGSAAAFVAATENAKMGAGRRVTE